MQTFFVSLTSISDVKKFVDAATRCSAEIDVLSGRYRQVHHGPVLSGSGQAREGGVPRH